MTVGSWLLLSCMLLHISSGFKWIPQNLAGLTPANQVSLHAAPRIKMPALYPEENTRIEPNKQDMETYAFILANVTDTMDSKPDEALSIMSKNLGWLLARDVPKLTELLLAEFPVLRSDQQMMKGYLYLLDFMETVVKRTSELIQSNQELLREVLEASKVSEKYFDEFVSRRSEDVTKSEFFMYLDTEIESQEDNTPMQNLLVTVKLRLLDEKGKSLGVDVMMLPKLASEDDPTELRRKTVQHISDYDIMGKELFLQTLRIMMKEMTKRYKNVDASLVLNLEEIDRIVTGELEIDRKKKQQP